MIFIGYGWGTPPKVPTTFTSPGDLQIALRGSPAAAFIPFIATPSPQLNGAQLITFIDASKNTRSMAVVSGTATGGPVALLQSTLYGPPSNQMTLQVAPGSVAGYRVTLSDLYGGSQFVGDNLTVPFQLAYSGLAVSGVSYSVTSGAFTVSSPIPGESISIPIVSGSFSTVALLTQFLNGTANWYAQALSATGGQLPSNMLSVTGNVLITPASGTTLNYVNVNAYLQDIPFWANQFANSIVTATVSGTTDTAAALPVTGAAVFFSGGTGVPPVLGDYATALNAALSVPGWTVFCDSALPAVQSLMAQHCLTASSVPYGMWRRGFTGSQIGDSVATTIANSRALDTKEMNYTYPGIWRVNTVTGQNQLYGGLYAAAAACAMATGNPIPTALTNKVLLATGVEAANAGSVLTPSQLNQLESNGILAIYTPRSTGVPTFLADSTTWEADNNIENTSSQQVACRFWLAYSMVNAVQPYVGEIAAPINEIAVLNAVKRCLNALKYTGGGSSGVLTSWDTGSLILDYTGENQTAAISVGVTLVGQNRFITAYVTVQPLQFQIVATG